MAIKSFKEIIDNRGYRISSKDREIFEEGTLQSFFGFSDSDIIEFIAYDVNDNQLPLQITPAGDTSLVKYIPLTSENIRNYFLIAEGTLLQIGNFPSEYFIDVKRILNDSGYDAGIFKTQVTLLNRRIGDYRKDINAKLWIKEISPSRTEIKILPQRNKVADSTDLLLRYNIFYNNGDFRDDTLQYVSEFINKINPQFVSEYIRNVYTEKWLNKLIEEFNVSGLDSLITQMHSKFIKAVINEFQNKISDINDVNFGKAKDTPIGLELSKEDVKNRCVKILTQVVDKYLPKRVIENTTADITLDESIDRIETILQRRESDVVIGATIPKIPIKVEKTQPVEESTRNKRRIQAIKDALGDSRPEENLNIADDIQATSPVGNSTSDRAIGVDGPVSRRPSNGTTTTSKPVNNRPNVSTRPGTTTTRKPVNNRPNVSERAIPFSRPNPVKTTRLTNDNLLNR